MVQDPRNNMGLAIQMFRNGNRLWITKGKENAP
jgi:hypothetical protein